MSLFGAMTTAISGLNAQSTAFSNVGDNLANSQTTGYKSVGTTFSDYISVSNIDDNQSGAVVARPQYNNSLQGGVAQSSNPLNVAISGQGFFPVSVPNGTNNGQVTFAPQQYYTRAGDFKMDSTGYLVNSTGHYLNGWLQQQDGTLDLTKVVPLQVGQSGYAPIATKNATIAANLPAVPTSTSAVTTEMPVYDSVGTARNLELSWTPKLDNTTSPPTAVPNKWNLSIAQQNPATTLGSVEVDFGATSGTPNISEGTIGSLTSTLQTTTPVKGQPATITLPANFGLGAQNITLNLGTYGGTDGVTQFDGSSYNLVSLSQDGVKAGSFSSVSMQANGNVIVNYDNGSSRTLARIPLVTFPSPDSLQREDGQAFQADGQSGNPRINQVGSNGAGSLVTSSTESSNVDIASEFTKLIVAQRAYSANTKMVTTADDMLQQTIDMKR